MNKWDSKRIAFISILIVLSISFVIIGTRFAALSSIPAIKLSLAGLPIKIIGFLFGPIVGFFTGFITDLVSFIFIPAFYYPLYSVALGISGMLPGLSSYFFNFIYKKTSKSSILKSLQSKKIYILYCLNQSILKNNNKKTKLLENRYKKIVNRIDEISNWKNEKFKLNVAIIISFIILFLIFIGLMITIFYIPDNIIDKSFTGILSLLKSRTIFATVISIGIGFCLIVLIIARFKMKENNFLIFVPIVVFIVITEFLNIPIIAYADSKALNIDFVVSMIGSLATSFIKIWFNTVIITFAIRITLPMISKKTFNGYE